ncbi:MAG: LuxR C-terminal-related transcriptional regulator [Acidimicrobiales bacterium]|nr:LuxR C-terminal-related transcriptional regulator [Acidimicrobiales bacterium]
MVGARGTGYRGQATGAAPWPLMGRDVEVAMAAEALAAGRGVVVAGAPGVGKTRLAGEVADRVRDAPQRCHVEWVTATTSGRGIPLAPFAHVVDDLTVPADRAFVPSPFASVRQRLLARAGGRPLVLVVDDAHLLDDASAALVHHLAGTSDVRLVATVRARQACPDAVVALWKDSHADRLELQPLTRSETGALLRGVLGGSVTEVTVDRLWSATRGNVLFLHELVRDGRRRGSLADSGGWWTWSGELGVPERLSDLVGSQLGRLADAEREAAELVALAEPVAWDQLSDLVTAEVVESLAEQGAVAVEETDTALTIRLAHPVFGDVLLGALGALRRRRLIARLADELEVGPTDPGLLRRVEWLVELGAEVPTDDLLDAARRSSLVAPGLARRLAETAARAGAGAAATVVLAQTDMFAGDGERAEQRLAAIDPAGLASEDRTIVTVMRANNLTFGLRRPDDAVALLDDLLVDPRARSGPGVDDSHGAAVSWVRGQRIPMLLFTGRLAEVLAEADAVVASSASSAADRMRAWLGMIPALALTGRPDAASALAATALASVGEVAVELPHALGQIGTGLMLARHWVGDFAAADGLARYAHDRGVADDVALQRGVAAFHLGLSAAWRGRLEEADGWFASAVTDLTDTDLGFLPSAIDNWRATRALLGRDVTVADPGPRFPLYETERLRLAGVVAAAGGDLPGARQAARASVERADAMGAVTYALFGWFDLARYGDPATAAPALAALVARVEGPLPALFAGAASALVADAADALDAASHRFVDVGLDLFAAEWAAAAALAHQRAGSRVRARGAAERAVRLAATCGHPRTALLRALTELDRPALTPRERDVVGLAAAGDTNAGIAEQLGLSVRTVETHLQRAFTKLGVNRRSELPDALGLDRRT